MTIAARLIAAAILTAASLSAAGCGAPEVAFDRAKWDRGRGVSAGENPRSAMVAEARAAGLTVGMDRPEVARLLGEPDARSDTHDVWYLGRAELAVDFRMLRIGYDANGKVATITEQTI